MDVSIYTRQNCSNVSYTVYHRFYCLHGSATDASCVYEMGGDLSQTVIDALNAKYHFDEPIIKQYGYFLQNIFLHWDWGTSAKMRPNVPVFEILRDRIPITLADQPDLPVCSASCWNGSRYHCSNQEKYHYRSSGFSDGSFIYFYPIFRIRSRSAVLPGI